MKSIIVIPARFGSSRLPGKPLKVIAGISLVERVYRVASSVKVDRVVVATDSQEIKQHAEGFGAEVVMTPETCRNGSERSYAALQSLRIKPDIIVNLQGDAPLSPPWFIQAVIDVLEKNPKLQIATPAVRLDASGMKKLIEAKKVQPSAGTLVTFDSAYDALYFSKNIIPFSKDYGSGTPVYKHIGIYAYRFSALEQYVNLPESTLEKAESLEQLRAIENGIKIRVIPVETKGRTLWSIDTPEDLKIAEEIIAREGELV